MRRVNTLTVPKLKSVKIIKDRDEKPKGFGYIEFAELDGLKDALAKSGSVSNHGMLCCFLLSESPASRR